MLYTDVDAVSKLAHWNILPLLPVLTGFEWSNVATLSSLAFRAKAATTRPDGKLFHATDAASTVQYCLSQMGALPEPEPDAVAFFADKPQIDAGEAVLFALTAADPNGFFLTGDKRALRALSQMSCAASFSGRILILEQILWRCLQLNGQTWLVENVGPYRHIDKATAMILGSRCDRSPEDIVEGIGSYLNEVSNLYSPSFLAPFELHHAARG